MCVWCRVGGVYVWVSVCVLNTDHNSLILPTTWKRPVRWSQQSSAKASLITCRTAAFRRGGERWSDSSNVNNKGLKLGGQHTEVMHNSTGKLIKFPFLCPLQLLGTRRVISFLALPPPLPRPRQLQEKHQDVSA